jgi:uncharacterized protein (TIGR02453 family)
MKRVLSFLADLRANNNREWFNANKGRYREASAVFDAFAESLIAAIGEFDPAVRGLTLRDCTYRIYRDTRFSPDKTPYKTHMGVYICPAGKKSGNAGYYFHIEPTGDGLIGGHVLDSGIYMPEPNVLKSVRDEIFDNGEAIMAAVRKAGGFELDRSNTLRRTPKGYPTDTPYDEYLRLKDFHMSKSFDDDYLLTEGLVERAAADFRTTYELVSLLNRATKFAHEEM